MDQQVKVYSKCGKATEPEFIGDNVETIAPLQRKNGSTERKLFWITELFTRLTV